MQVLGIHARVGRGGWLTVVVGYLVAGPSPLIGQTSTRPMTAAAIDRVVSDVQREFAALPGVAVAVINADGSTVRRTFGYRDVEAKLPVTELTQFPIASLTKSFVGAAIRAAAETGELDLDVPLSSLLPDLTLPPPLNVDHVSLRDLLTHRSGIQHDAVSFRTSMSGDLPDAEVLRLLSSSSVAIPRSFHYSNIGYLLAAIVAERRTGKTWRALVQEKVLSPAALERTSTAVPAGPDVALRYAATGRHTFVRLPEKTSRSYHAAGGMTSTLVDLTRWLRLQIHRGRLGGRQIIPQRVMAELHSVQIGVKSTFGGFQRIGYGLGWYVVDYEGELMIQCFGSHAGSRVHLSFLPERRVGIVVIANEGRDAVYLPDVIAHGLYDRILRRTDIPARQQRRFDEQRAWFARARAARADVRLDYQDPIPLPTGLAARYAGTYQDSAYGTIRIEAAEGGLRAVMGDLMSFLEARDSLNFAADFTPGGLPEGQKLKFRLRDGNAVEGFEIQFGRQPSFFVRR